MDLKLGFKEFIEKYLSPETTASARDIVPYVDEGGALLEFYSYQLLVHDEKTDRTIIVGHPDYMEVGVVAYLDFLLDMQKAINEKQRSLCPTITSKRNVFGSSSPRSSLTDQAL